MQLLNVFASGALIWVISAIALGLIILFGYQAVKAHNSGWKSDSVLGGHREGNDKIPFVKIPQFWGAVVVAGLYILALFLIASDYKGL